MKDFLEKRPFLVHAVVYAIFAISIGLLTNSLQEQSDKAKVTATEIVEIRESDPCVQKPVNKQGCKQFLKGLANDEIFPQRLVCYIFERGSESAKACEVALEKRKDKEPERAKLPRTSSVFPHEKPKEISEDNEKQQD